MQETEEDEVLMMCWENMDGSLAGEPNEEATSQNERADNKMEIPKDEEEHANSTLHTSNQLKLLIEEFSWGTEDNTSMLDTEETAQQKLVYITKLENDLQNYGIELNEEESPKDKKPPVKNRPFERPSLINLNDGSKLYEEYGSENDIVEEMEREKNTKNMKEFTYTNIGCYDSGEQAKLQKIEKPKNDHEIPRNQKNENSLVTRNDSFQPWKEHFYR